MVDDVHKTFASRRLLGGARDHVPAVAGVSLTISAGETVAVVGESGSGKSTLARMVVRLERPDRGTITFDGTDVMRVSRPELRRMRRRFQMVFQDPYSAFDPTSPVGVSLEEPLVVHDDLPRDERLRRVGDILVRIGLAAEDGARYPGEFSGGQLQRIAIARAILTEPSLLVCDEPVASLDVSIRGQVLNLLADLQDERGLAYLFISHDLSVVERFAHRVVVMYAGQIMEEGTTSEIFENPQHPYTKALLEAIPLPDPTRHKDRSDVRGERLALADLGPGCPYATRCPWVMDVCREEKAPLLQVGDAAHRSACHLHGMDPGTGAGDPVVDDTVADGIAGAH